MEGAKEHAEDSPKKQVRRIMSVEARARLSKIMKEYFQNPDNRVKVTSGWNSAKRAEMSKKAKAYWTKARRNEASKRAKAIWAEFKQWESQHKNLLPTKVKSA